MARMNTREREMTLRLDPKRATAVAVALILLALGLAACGGGDDTTSGGGSTGAAETEAESETGGGGEETASNTGGAPSWCGEEEISLALADGFGDNNWRKITTAEAENEASKCPAVSEFIYTDGQGDTQKAISDLEGLTAQGVDAAVVFPDAGKAMLPAITNMFKAG